MVFHRLIKTMALALWLAIVPAGAETPTDVQRLIVQEALNSRVPPSLALALARVESNFQARAESPVGARGVMQIMPKTAREVFGVHADQLWNARLNIRLGIKFLEQLYDQYGKRWDLALSHYNGGTLVGGSGASAIPHNYTRKYVADVLRWQRVFAQGAPAPRTTTVARYSPSPRAERPWRESAAKPWRRIDPLEFDEWAQVEQRRLARRRGMDDFAAGG